MTNTLVSPPSAASRDNFKYTFDNLAEVIGRFTEVIGLNRFAIYIFDYGAPAGLRIAAKQPERISSIISQNGNAYEEELNDGWNPIQAYWREPNQANRDALRSFLTPETTLFQHTDGVADPSLVAPDGRSLDDYYLARPGAHEAQLDLFLDYASNVALYLEFHAYFRKHQPPFLAVWSRNDPFSCRPAPRRFGAICRTLISASSTRATSHWRRTAERLPPSFATFSSGRRVCHPNAGKRSAPCRCSFVETRSGGLLMRAIVIQQFGGPENLVIKEIPDPEPKPGHVVIQVKAFGINHAEMHMRRGEWAEAAEVSGIECVGLVKSCPGGEFAVGAKVAALMGGMGRTINGSYGEYTCPPATNVASIESDLPWEDLAAIPESYATAWTCLFRNLELAAGQTLVIRGAMSSFGQAALNMAVNAGANVIATARNRDRFQLLEALGAQRVEVECPDLSERITE